MAAPPHRPDPDRSVLLPRPSAVGLIVAGVVLVPAVIAHGAGRGDRSP